MTQQNAADDEKSAFQTAFDAVQENASTDWQSTTVTETFEVYIPKGDGEELLEAAWETWEENADEEDPDPPRSFADAPEHQLKERVAERVARERFLDRHEVKSAAHLDMYAKNGGRTRLMNDESGRYTAEVWEVTVHL